MGTNEKKALSQRHWSRNNHFLFIRKCLVIKKKRKEKQTNSNDKTHLLTCFITSHQGGWPGDSHPHPKHRRLLRPVRRGEVCHPVRAGGLLHGGEWHPAGQGRDNHRAQVSLELLGPHHREVCASLALLGLLTAGKLIWLNLTNALFHLDFSCSAASTLVDFDEHFFLLKVEYSSGPMRAILRFIVKVANIFHLGEKTYLHTYFQRYSWPILSIVLL